MLFLHRLWHRVNAMARHLQDDPLLGFAYLITTALAIAGIAQSVEWIFASAYSTFYLVGFSGLILVMLMAYFLRPPAMRFFNISRLGKVVSLSQHQELEVDEDGWASLRFSQSVLFLEPPNPDDYRDKLHCDEKMDFDLLNYVSTDLVPIRIERENASLVTVYLKPKTEAEVLKPWSHEFSFDIPENVGLDFYCVRIAIHTPVGLSSVRVSSRMPLEHIICFKEPRSLAGENYDRLARYVLRHTHSDAPSSPGEISIWFSLGDRPPQGW